MLIYMYMQIHACTGLDQPTHLRDAPPQPLQSIKLQVLGAHARKYIHYMYVYMSTLPTGNPALIPVCICMHPQCMYVCMPACMHVRFPSCLHACSQSVIIIFITLQNQSGPSQMTNMHASTCTLQQREMIFFITLKNKVCYL
jgi:hypothetical protein